MWEHVASTEQRVDYPCKNETTAGPRTSTKGRHSVLRGIRVLCGRSSNLRLVTNSRQRNWWGLDKRPRRSTIPENSGEIVLV